MAPLSTVALLELDASGLRRMLDDGKLTSVALMKQVLAQIEQEDKAGAKLQTILNTASRELLLRQDAIATHPDLGIPTTVGSFALVTSKPAKNAAVVDELIKNGLIILAKTNLNEFCNWKGFNSVNGFSGVGGQTNSAYVVGGLREDEASMGHSSPLGSSTGSAVGVSAGFSPLSLGTETDGSLVQPAARAALYALKPTVGSTDHRGVWTLSKRFDAVGAIAKSVSDLALATEMLHTMEVRSRLPEDGYLSFLSKSFTGLKVGFLDESQWHLPPQMCPQIPSVVQQLNGAYKLAIEKIRDAGAEVQYPVVLHGVEKLLMENQTGMSIILFHEYKKNVDDYLEGLDFSEVRSLKELIEWNKEHADIEMPYQHANQGRLIKAYEEVPNATAYESAIAHLHKVSIKEGFDLLFGDKGLDLVGVPMDSKIPSMATASGYPIATMPLGILDHLGRPFGLAIKAPAGREDVMFKFMSAFEAVFPKRAIPPQLVKADEAETELNDAKI
ncbi:amidase signature enzyme [Trematosphaeria pertusa]|uniref:Amidase signature enzyme n=1 Tax=Trematosphaeria pertusa TaxID=390896 RepID=A0A6A6J445_9PLEO|nr:amidase signature enzyme [Trematosphaeria pertusa]KAF2257469.1 amidase signature enzyme [Trematosphaeria pertusa]